LLEVCLPEIERATKYRIRFLLRVTA